MTTGGWHCLYSGGQWEWPEGPWEWYQLVVSFVLTSSFVSIFVFMARHFSKCIFKRVISGHLKNFNLFGATIFVPTNWLCPSGRPSLFLFNRVINCCGLPLGHSLTGMPYGLGISASPLLRDLPVAGGFLFWAFCLWGLHLDVAPGISIPSLMTIFPGFLAAVLQEGNDLKTAVSWSSSCLSTLIPGCNDIFTPFFHSSVGYCWWDLVIISLSAFSSQVCW